MRRSTCSAARCTTWLSFATVIAVLTSGTVTWSQQPGRVEPPLEPGATPHRGGQQVSLSEAELAELRASLNRAETLAQSADWSGALAIYQRVAQRRITPGLRYLIAGCHERLGDFPKALEAFEDAARLAAEDGSAYDVRINAPAKIEALRQQVAALRFVLPTASAAPGSSGSSTRPAGVEIDDKSVLIEDPSHATYVMPGRHTVRWVPVAGEGARRRDVSVAAGESVTITFEAARPAPVPRAAPAPKPPGERRPGHRMTGPAWIALGATGVFAAASVVTGWVYVDERSEYEAALARDRASNGWIQSRESLTDMEARGRTWGIANVVSIGATAFGAGATGWLWWRGDRGGTAEPSSALAGRVGVGMRGKF